MDKIAGLTNRSLLWAQDSAWTQRFTLTAHEHVVGHLEFPSMWGTLAKGETGDGCWTFKRLGFWQQRAGIRRCGSEEDIAVFTNQTWSGGGTLVCESGLKVRATTNMWHTNLRFENLDGEELVRFDHGGVFKLRSELTVSAAGRSLPELPILVLFGWYLAVMLHHDSTASSGAVVAAMG